MRHHAGGSESQTEGLVVCVKIQARNLGKNMRGISKSRHAEKNMSLL